jgi:hypothetical protein
MSRARSFLVSISLSFTVGLNLGFTACPSSSPTKGSQVPSEMLGPTESSAPTRGTAAAPAPTAPETAAPPTASAPAGPTAPTAPTASLSAAEEATLNEMKALMKDVTSQFERLVSTLEQSGADCKKASTALSTSQRNSAVVDKKMEAFKAKLESGPQPSPALMAQLRETTLAAFPAGVRARAETTFDRLEKQCANDADFQRAKAAAAAAGS